MQKYITEFIFLLSYFLSNLFDLRDSIFHALKSVDRDETQISCVAVNHKALAELPS